MAKNKVEIDVKVDDKGTTAKVGLGAKKASENLDKTGTSAHTADRRLKGTAQASSNTTKNFSKMAQGITGGLVPAYATFAANMFALSAAFNFLKRSADIRNLRASQLAFTESTGQAMGLLTSRLREAADGMLSFQAAGQAAAISMAKGFSPAQLEQIAVGARKVSTALGRDFEDSFDRLVRGASKAEPELLDELGITLRLANATERYAKTVNKNVKDLTEYERSQAVLAETMRQIDTQFGEVIPKTNEFTKLGKTFGDIVDKVAAKALPAIESFVGFINDNMGSAVAIVGLFAVSLVKSATNFDILGEKAQDFADRQKANMATAKQNLSNLQSYGKQTIAGQGRMQMSTSNMARDAMQGLGNDSDLSRKMQAGGTAGLNAAERKKALSALKRAERQIIKGHHQVLDGMYKGATAAQLRTIRMGHEAMAQSSKVTTSKIATNFQKATFFLQIQFKKAQVAGVTAFQAIGRAAAFAGGAIAKIANAFMWLAMAKMAFDLIKGLVDKMKANQGIMDFTEANKEVADSLKEIEKNANAAIKAIGKMETASGKSEVRMNAFSTIDFGAQGDKIAGKFTGRVEDQAAKDAARRAELESQNLDIIALTKRQRQGKSDVPAHVLAHNERVVELNKELLDIKARQASEETNMEAAIKAETEAEEELLAIVKSLGNEKFTAAFAARNESEASKQAFEDLSDAINKQKAETKAYNGELNSLKDMSAMNADAAFFYTNRLKETGETLEANAAKVGETSSAISDFHTALRNQGVKDVNAFTQALEEVMATEKKLLDLRNQEAVQGIQNQGIASGFAKEQAAERLAVMKAENDLIAANNALKTANTMKVIEGDAASEKAQATAVQQAEHAVATATATKEMLEKTQDEGFKMLSAASQAFESSFVSSMTQVFQGTMSLKDAFKNMAKSVVQSLMQVITKLILIKTLEGTALGGLLGYKMGGIATPPGRSYANGGTSRGSGRGYSATLHGTEAIVPLPGGRSIPVEMKGRGAGGGDVNNVSINITNTGGGAGAQCWQRDPLLLLMGPY